MSVLTNDPKQRGSKPKTTFNSWPSPGPVSDSPTTSVMHARSPMLSCPMGTACNPCSWPRGMFMENPSARLLRLWLINKLALVLLLFKRLVPFLMELMPTLRCSLMPPIFRLQLVMTSPITGSSAPTTFKVIWVKPFFSTKHCSQQFSKSTRDSDPLERSWPFDREVFSGSWASTSPTIKTTWTSTLRPLGKSTPLLQRFRALLFSLQAIGTHNPMAPTWTSKPWRSLAWRLKTFCTLPCLRAPLGNAKPMTSSCAPSTCTRSWAQRLHNHTPFPTCVISFPLITTWSLGT